MAPRLFGVSKEADGNADVVWPEKDGGGRCHDHKTGGVDLWQDRVRKGNPLGCAGWAEFLSLMKASVEDFD